MKIAVWHNLPRGGGKRALHDQVKGLVSRGHEVEAWCLSTADSDYMPLASMVREHVIPYDAQPQPLLKKLDRAASRLFDTPGSPHPMELACGKCAHEMAAGGFDVLLAHTCRFYHSPAIGREMARAQPELPRVLYLQEPLRRLYEAMPRLTWAAPAPVPWGREKPRALAARLRNAVALHHDRILARAEVDNARAFDAILVNSYFSRESIARAYHLDARVCYLGVDTSLFTPTTEAREFFVLGVGDVAGRKRPLLTVEAVAAIPVPRPTLVWVGNQADENVLANMRAAAAAKGVDLDVRLGVSDQELVDLFRRARLVIYVPRLEPFGYVPLEANACGTPVIGVAEGGLRETIRDGVNGFLCEPDPESLAAGMRRILDDPATAARISAEAPGFVQEEWSVGRATVRLEEELRRAIRDRTAVGV